MWQKLELSKAKPEDSILINEERPFIKLISVEVKSPSGKSPQKFSLKYIKNSRTQKKEEFSIIPNLISNVNIKINEKIGSSYVINGQIDKSFTSIEFELDCEEPDICGISF